jgi:hypothetical protein
MAAAGERPPTPKRRVLADPDHDALDISANSNAKKPHSTVSRAGGVVADKNG